MLIVVAAAGSKNFYTRLLFKKLKEEAVKNDFACYETSADYRRDDAKNTLVFIELSTRLLRRLQQKNWLKKTKPDLVFWIDEYHELNYQFKQCLLLTDPDTASAFWNAAPAQCRVFTLSPWEQQLLSKKWGSELPPIEPLLIFPDTEKKLHAFSNSEIPAGSNYFYCDTDGLKPDEIVGILKAFSAFKKWQLSAMQLVLKGGLNSVVHEKMATFKYRNDVVMTNDEGAQRASYAVIFPSAEPAAYPKIYEYLNEGLVVIADDNKTFREVYGDSIYFCDMKSDKQLGTALVELYKKEELTEALKSKSEDVVRQLESDSNMRLFWQKLIQCAEEKP